jgi:hypothetical protein
LQLVLLTMMFKKNSVILVILISSLPVFSQKIDSIYFHLYTDSLKKGQHNYINIDGKLSNGHWKPLTTKEVELSSSACEFQGNELIIPADFKEEKIKIKASLKNDPSISKEAVIWIKKIPDPASLPTVDQILKKSTPQKKKKD